MNSRVSKAKTNIYISFLCQILTLVCGFIIPQLFIRNYGSEVYGVTASITQFLAYITLLEGGVAGVARAALYRPLAENDEEKIGIILKEIKDFFRVIGVIFAIYVIVLAVSFNGISRIECFDWFSTALLVAVISISTFAQYFIGISYAVLLQASQRQYITNLINIITMVINTILIVVLVRVGFSIIIVKLVSSIIFVFRPIMMWIYVKRNFRRVYPTKHHEKELKQKWTALGQHIAYFLHSNTDIAVLTIFGNLRMVAVYSVYNMVVASIQSLTVSFTAGMEAVFGNMLAKEEKNELHNTFGYYETLISVISVILFSVTASMILSFVLVYTKGVTDANYREPLFAILLVIAALVFCLRLPYHSIVIAAGHFRETKIAGYGEALINISTSIVLVIKFGLVGVAIGTVLAVMFRFFFYVTYLSKHIFNRNVKLFVTREIINVINFAVIVIISTRVVRMIDINSYLSWMIVADVVSLFAGLVTILFNWFFYRKDIRFVMQKILKKKQVIEKEYDYKQKPTL